MDRLDWQVADFRAWLQRYPEQVIIGHTGASCDCPLSNWREELGERWEVLTDCAVVFLTGTSYPLPDWASSFVMTIDGDGDEPQYIPVTAGECLSALTELGL